MIYNPFYTCCQNNFVLVQMSLLPFGIRQTIASKGDIKGKKIYLPTKVGFFDPGIAHQFFACAGKDNAAGFQNVAAAAMCKDMLAFCSTSKIVLPALLISTIVWKNIAHQNRRESHGRLIQQQHLLRHSSARGRKPASVARRPKAFRLIASYVHAGAETR